MATNITASANFQSVITEIAKLATAYKDYNQVVGKSVSANLNFVKSSKTLVTQINAQAQAQDALNKVNARANKIKNAPPTPTIPRGLKARLDELTKSIDAYIIASSRAISSNRLLGASFVAINAQLQPYANNLRDSVIAMGGFNRMAQIMGQSSRNMGNSLLQSTEGVLRLSLSLESFVRLGVLNLTSRAISSFTTSLIQGSQKAIDFEKKIGQIRAISTDAPLSFNEWATSIRNVSDEFNIELLDATASAYEAISNQVVKGAETFDFLRTSADLAITSQGTLTQAVNAITSVIKSYGKNTSEAREISAKLFKVVELGRVKLEDIADQLGTVTIIASRAGVSFEEISSALSTLTVQGVTPANALTFLRNVILTILKPTDAMKEAVRKMGFATAEAGVKALGLGKFIFELGETTNGTSSELTEMFGSIRASIGAFGISGKSAKLYEKNLVEINNALDNFNDRVALAKDSGGFKLSAQFNKTANEFISFAEKMNSSLGKFLETLGGLPEIAKRFGEGLLALGILGTIILIDKLTLALINMGVGARQGAQGLTVLQTQMLATQIKAGGLVNSFKTLALGVGSLIKSFAPFLILDLSISGINKVFEKQRELIAKDVAVVDNFNDSISRLTNKTTEDAIKFANTITSLQDQIALNATRDNLKALNSLEDSLKSSSDAFKKYNKAKLDDAKLALKSLEEEEKRLEGTIKLTNTLIDTIRKGQEKLSDDRFGKGFSSSQKLGGLEEDLNVAIQEGSVTRVTKVFEELTKTLNELIDSTDNKSVIAGYQAKLDSINKKTLAFAEEANRKDLIQRERNIDLLARKQAEVNAREEAQNILNRVSLTEVVKSKTREETEATGIDVVTNLNRALQLAPTEGDKARIAKQLDDVNEFIARKIFSFDKEEIAERRKALAEEMKVEIEKLSASVQNEVKLLKSREDIASFVDSTLTGISDISSANESSISPKRRRLLDRINKDLVEFRDKLRKNDEEGFQPVTEEEVNKLGERLANIRVEFQTFSAETLNDGIGFFSSLSDLSDKAEALRLVLRKDTGSRLTATKQELDDAYFKTFKLLQLQEQQLALIKKAREEKEKDRGINSDKEEKRLEAQLAIRKKEAELRELNKRDQLTFDQFKVSPNEIISLKLKEETTQSVSDIFEQGVKEGVTKALSSFNEDLFNKLGITGGKLFTQNVPSGEEPTESFKKAVEDIKNEKTDSSGRDLPSKQSLDRDISEKRAKESEKILNEAIQKEIEKNLASGGKDTPSSRITAEARVNITKAEEELKILIEKRAEASIEGEKKLTDFQKEELDVQIKIKEENLKRAKLALQNAKNADQTTIRGRFNSFVDSNKDFSTKVNEVGKAVESFGSVLEGTSRKLDLTGLQALNLGSGFNAVAGGIQFFVNALLAPKRKNLSSKQKLGVVLQSGVQGAGTGSAIGGVYGAVIGGAIGIGAGFYSVYEKGGLVYRSGGGLAYLAGGGAPRGSDTVPAMLTKGEFVMNRGATDKFYAQIRAMNNYSHFSDGGRVQNQSTNIGDINLTVSGGSPNTAVDVRALGNQLRREIKRGRLGSLR